MSLAPTRSLAPSDVPTPSPTNMCRNLCKYSSAGLYEQVHQIMHELEWDTNRTSVEFGVEVKILLLEQDFDLEAAADAEFEDLSALHAATEARYVAALASLGLSPAREDEMGLVEEMEAAVAQKQAAAADLAARSLGLAAGTLDGTEGAATGGAAGGAAAHKLGAVPLVAAMACLFAAGVLLEKGRGALAARPV